MLDAWISSKEQDGGQQAFYYKRQNQSQRANGFRRMLVGLSASLFQPRASSFNGAFPCAVELPDVTPWKCPECPEQSTRFPHAYRGR